MDERNKIKIIKVILWAVFIFLLSIGSIVYVMKNKSAFSASDEVITSVPNNGETYTTERYYCTAKTEEEAAKIASDASGELESYADGIGVITVKKTVKVIFGLGELPDEIEAGVGVLKKDTVYTIESGKPPRDNTDYDAEWYLSAVNINNTYKNGITGKGTLVAVIDTGCQVDHPDLKNNIVGVYNAANPDKADNVKDINGHGTHVAGIIAAEDNSIGTIGIAPDASLFIIKADHGTDGCMFESDLIRGVNKAVEVGADVINLSLGGFEYDEDFEAAIKNAVNSGAICIAAAGNYSTDVSFYPACLNDCFGVASYQSDLSLAESSDFGANADIAAPGRNIYSTYTDGSYRTMSGTSMACPVVSGIAALIYGENDSLRNNNSAASVSTVRNMLNESKDGRVYSSSKGTVTGGVNAQNIFYKGNITTPAIPILTQKVESGTNQVIIKLKCDTKNADIYYSTDGSYPYVRSAKKYDKKIRLDKKGTYKIRAVAVTGRTYSNLLKQKIVVDGNVYSQKLINSMQIHFKNKDSVKAKLGTEKQLYVTFENNKKKKVNLQDIKWTSSNKKLATVDTSGKVKVTSDKKKIGKSVTISGTFGSVTKTFSFTLK